LDANSSHFELWLLHSAAAKAGACEADETKEFKGVYAVIVGNGEKRAEAGKGRGFAEMKSIGAEGVIGATGEVGKAA
jgi:hypothetical protein